MVTPFLPHLNRDAVYRILRAEGLNRLPPADRTRKRHGTFKEDEIGFVHLDVKHLPKLRNRDGITPKRSLYVAIDRCSRWVHLAVKTNKTTASATAFLKEAIRAFPFPVTHVLTNRGSCFVADAFEAACRTLKVEHRTTRPYTPRTNGMVEPFTGAARGARHHHPQPPRSRGPAARLQPRLQRPAPARAGRRFPGRGGPTTAPEQSPAEQPTR